MQALHVIATGSLLEFVLHDADFSFPVGRVQFLYMRPLSFVEFLQANNLLFLCNYLKQVSLSNPPTEAVHNECLKHLRSYFRIGGMPACIQKYLETASLLEASHLQHALLQTYERDFGKYATKAEHRYLQRLFEKCPEFVGTHVRYSKIDPEAANPAREYKQAIKLLGYAGLISSVQCTQANGIPLRAEASEKKFKLLFVDIGLLQSAMGMDPALFLSEGSPFLVKGPVAEQFVGQELLAYANPYLDTKLYFWERVQKGSDAEIDYTIQLGEHILPIEVKAATAGRLKSLRQFMAEKKCAVGIKISEEPLTLRDGILSVPFYLIAELPRLVQEAMK